MVTQASRQQPWNSSLLLRLWLWDGGGLTSAACLAACACRSKCLLQQQQSPTAGGSWRVAAPFEVSTASQEAAQPVGQPGCLLQHSGSACLPEPCGLQGAALCRTPAQDGSSSSSTGCGCQNIGRPTQAGPLLTKCCPTCVTPYLPARCLLHTGPCGTPGCDDLTGCSRSSRRRRTAPAPTTTAAAAA